MKTIKNRKRKVALGVKIAAMLSCVAIASVGFASWLILINPEGQSQTGNITASSVSEQGLELSTAWEGNANPSIVLGKPEATANANAWLTASDEVGVEVLTATLNVTYTPINISSATITVDFLAHIGAKPANGEWAEDTSRLAAIKDYVGVKVSVSGTGVTAQSKEYLNGLEPIVIELSNLTDVTTAQTFTVKVEFMWKFGTGVNPYTYFNAITNPTATDRADAKTALSDIYTAIHGTSAETTDDLNFEVTVVGTFAQ